jgi:hypothetical protein
VFSADEFPDEEQQRDEAEDLELEPQEGEAIKGGLDLADAGGTTTIMDGVGKTGFGVTKPSSPAKPGKAS